MTTKNNVSVILLAGGHGSRMNNSIPKQYLKLGHKEIAKYSFECFAIIPEVTEIIVVCRDEYRLIFDCKLPNTDLHFATPGKRRQDSVYSGFKAIKHKANLVCIHDAARPFITTKLVKRIVEAAQNYGAATAGVPMKCTVKQVNTEEFITCTPDRSLLWEIQTPQVITPDSLERGFTLANEQGITVTDDVSLAELIGTPVKLVMGDYKNIKITTPEDLYFAEKFLEQCEGIPELQTTN